MSRFSNKTLAAVQALIASVGGCHGVEIKPAAEHLPKGEMQDCDAGIVPKEWVDQRGPGMAGDEFYGTVTWKLGDFYLIASYAS
jgi:hypothetical protein